MLLVVTSEQENYHFVPEGMYKQHILAFNLKQYNSAIIALQCWYKLRLSRKPCHAVIVTCYSESLRQLPCTVNYLFSELCFHLNVGERYSAFRDWTFLALELLLCFLFAGQVCQAQAQGRTDNRTHTHTCMHTHIQRERDTRFQD